MILSYQYRLYPNKTQFEELQQQLNCCRKLYNEALAERRDTWKEEKKSLNYYDQANQLKQKRIDDPMLGNVNFSTLQQVLRNVDKTYKAFFRRVKQGGQKAGFPRFKSDQRFNSLMFRFGDGSSIKNGRLRIQNVGLLKVKWHRPLIGKAKQVLLTRKNEKWYVTFSVEVDDIAKVPVQAECGIDVGLEKFLVTSDDEQIENPRFLRKEEQRLRTLQKEVSRKKKGSANRNKSVKQLRKQHERIKNCRKNFHHQIAYYLLSKYQQIFVESLNVKGMVKNHHLAKSISDAGWTSFLNILTSKAESAGCQVVEVNPKRTSQICSDCGQIVKKSLSVRLHRCNSCGLEIDRDLNAAINIKRLGLSLCGEDVRPKLASA